MMLISLQTTSSTLPKQMIMEDVEGAGPRLSEQDPQGRALSTGRADARRIIDWIGGLNEEAARVPSVS